MRHRPLERLLRWPLLLACVHLGAPAAADVRVLLASDTPYYRETAASLQHTLEHLAPGIPLSTHTQIENWPADDVLVSVGASAMTALRERYPERPGLHLFVTSDFWREQRAADAGLDKDTAVALDQPPQRLLTLARVIDPEAHALSVVLGPLARAHADALTRAAVALDFNPRVGVLAPGENPIAALAPLVNGSQVVVVLPDSAEFNGATARWLLQLSFRARIPVIGYSRAYTDAGALASVYSTPGDIGRQAAELIAQRLARGAFPPGLLAPSHYTLSTNTAVAEALGINLPTDTALLARYATALGEQP